MYKKGQTNPEKFIPIFLAWDLSMHWRTHIWFFNQFVCTGAFACSLILNCAREMARKRVYSIKCPNEPWIIPILLRHAYSCMFTQIKGLPIQTASIVAVTPFCNSNLVDPTQFIITNHVRCSTKYLGSPSVYSTPMAYARRCVVYSPQPACQAH